MRGGKLLAEASPTELLEKFNTRSLEEVFLILSQKQEAGVLETNYESNMTQFSSNLSIETQIEENSRSVEVSKHRHNIRYTKHLLVKC